MTSAATAYVGEKRHEVPSATSNRPDLKRPASHRLPPPSLFQGPPSRNASHISLALSPSVPSSSKQQTRSPRASRIPPASSFSGPSLGVRKPQNSAAQVQNETDRADALWAEMQNTLAEVELSAMNSSHVFGASHAKALEDLRTSQLALAQAWAKSEADEMGDHDADLATADASTGAVKDSPLGQSPSERREKQGKDTKVGKNLEEETEKDVLLARKRREANDRYFQQVNSGVLDVVSKLEDVASAMRKVEKESREIWSESDSGGSVTEDTEATEATELARSPGG